MEAKRKADEAAALDEDIERVKREVAERKKALNDKKEKKNFYEFQEHDEAKDEPAKSPASDMEPLMLEEEQEDELSISIATPALSTRKSSRSSRGTPDYVQMATGSPKRTSRSSKTDASPLVAENTLTRTRKLKKKLMFKKPRGFQRLLTHGMTLKKRPLGLMQASFLQENL